MKDILDAPTGNWNPEQSFKYASKGKRLVNCLIDRVICRLCMSFLSVGLSSYSNSLFLSERLTTVGDVGFTYLVIIWLLPILLYFFVTLLYYTIFEYYLKGKTIGKLVTKTRAIAINNDLLSLRQAFLRSLVRVVPFNSFSFLGDIGKGWHDNWTNTKVIDDDGWPG